MVTQGREAETAKSNNQTEILELRNLIPEMKNSRDGLYY